MAHRRPPQGPQNNYSDDPINFNYLNEYGPDFLVTKCPSYTEQCMVAQMINYDPDDYYVSESNARLIKNIVTTLGFAISNNFNWGGNPQHIRENVYEIFDKRLREFTPQQLDDPDYRNLRNLIRQWRSMVEVPTINSMEIPQGPE
jgi:hypothetical protein